MFLALRGIHCARDRTRRQYHFGAKAKLEESGDGISAIRRPNRTTMSAQKIECQPGSSNLSRKALQVLRDMQRMDDPFGILGGCIAGEALADSPGWESTMAALLGAAISHSELDAHVGDLEAKIEAPVPVPTPAPEDASRRQRAKTGNLKTGKLKQPKAAASTASAPNASATALAEDNICPQCSARMHVLELEYKCGACGLIIEGLDGRRDPGRRNGGAAARNCRAIAHRRAE